MPLGMHTHRDCQVYRQHRSNVMSHHDPLERLSTILQFTNVTSAEQLHRNQEYVAHQDLASTSQWRIELCAAYNYASPRVYAHDEENDLDDECCVVVYEATSIVCAEGVEFRAAIDAWQHEMQESSEEHDEQSTNAENESAESKAA